MAQKFKILRIVAFIWKIIAWVVLVVSILGACGILALSFTVGDQLTRTTSAYEFGIAMVGGRIGAIVTAVFVLLFGIFNFISLYVVAETIDVMLALEENTRAMVEQLKNMVKG